MLNIKNENDNQEIIKILKGASEKITNTYMEDEIKDDEDMYKNIIKFLGTENLRILDPESPKADKCFFQ